MIFNADTMTVSSIDSPGEPVNTYATANATADAMILQVIAFMIDRALVSIP